MELAWKVHAQHLVEIGPLYSLKQPAAALEEEQGYLIIEEIEGVEPLDLQMGVDPKLTVPEVLWEALFGESEPDTGEGACDGDTVAPMGTYAVLDAGKMPYLLTASLQGSGLEYQSLFQGETQEELKEYAPYLVRLEEGNDFTRKLFTQADPPLGLWDKGLGIYLRSRASFAQVRKHLRKFTRIQDEQGKWYFFRFWEGCYIEGFLQHSSMSVTSKFFTHVSSVIYRINT